MRRTIEADLDAPAGVVHARLDTLDVYPAWLDLVARVEATTDRGDEPGPAWLVTLRAHVGPFARSKRLRMVRTVSEAPTRLRFERSELDDRRHSAWVLDVDIVDLGARSRVRVDLTYEGRLWSPVLDAVLGAHIDDAVPRLQAAVSG